MIFVDTEDIISLPKYNWPALFRLVIVFSNDIEPLDLTNIIYQVHHGIF